MCRAKDEGPRCSYGGRIRIERAQRNLDRVQRQVAREKEARTPDENGEYKLSARLQKQADNANRRMRQARVVWYATNAGVAQLNDKIEQEQVRLENIDRSLPARKQRTQENSANRNIASFRRQIEQGNADRATMRANKKLLEGDEKRQIRDKMIAQGAEINERAQRATPETAASRVNADKDQPLELKEWTRDDVKDLAKNWVEDGTRTGWKENPHVRPSKNLAGGKPFAPATSSMLRMNTPDGSVGEVRVDIHQIKGNDGKYHVEVRKTSAATNLQSSPYDTVGLELGSIISSKTGAMSKNKTLVTKSFKSKAEAEKFVKQQRNSISQTLAVDTALEMRNSTRAWALKTASQKKLQTTKQAGAHLYSAKGAGVAA